VTQTNNGRAPHTNSRPTQPRTPRSTAHQSRAPGTRARPVCSGCVGSLRRAAGSHGSTAWGPRSPMQPFRIDPPPHTPRAAPCNSCHRVPASPQDSRPARRLLPQEISTWTLLASYSGRLWCRQPSPLPLPRHRQHHRQQQQQQQGQQQPQQQQGQQQPQPWICRQACWRTCSASCHSTRGT